MLPKLAHFWIIFLVIAAWKRIYFSIEPASKQFADQQYKVGEPLLQIQYTFGNCRICGCSSVRIRTKCAFGTPDNSRSQMCPGMSRNLGTDYLVAMTVYIFLSNFESQLSHVFFSRPLSQQVIVLGRFQSQFSSLALRFGFDFLQFLFNQCISVIHVRKSQSRTELAIHGSNIFKTI